MDRFQDCRPREFRGWIVFGNLAERTLAGQPIGVKRISPNAAPIFQPASGLDEILMMTGQVFAAYYDPPTTVIVGDSTKITINSELSLLPSW